MKSILWLFSVLLLFVSAVIAQTQSVPADVVAMLRKQARMTYVDTQIPHNEEYVAAVLSNGSLVYTMVIDRGGKLNLPQGVMLLLHTHPYGAQRQPSDADRATAKKISAPNCVVTAREVWCAMPNGQIVRGELAARQRSGEPPPLTPMPLEAILRGMGAVCTCQPNPLARRIDF